MRRWRLADSRNRLRVYTRTSESIFLLTNYSNKSVQENQQPMLRLCRSILEQVRCPSMQTKCQLYRTGAAGNHVASARHREEATWGGLVLGARTRLFCLLLRAAARRSLGGGGGGGCGGRVGGLRRRLGGGGLLLRRAAGSVHLELALLESGQRGPQVGRQRVLPEEVRVERFVGVDPHLRVQREQPIEQLEREVVAHERAQLLLHHALQTCSKNTILIRKRLAFRSGFSLLTQLDSYSNLLQTAQLL